MTLIHGGMLHQVAQQYQIPINDWLDLSTGISPLSYPIPEIPSHLWQQLPQENSILIKAAKQYYRCDQLLVTNGSQSIIKILPKLWQINAPSSKTVYLPQRGYKEHAQAWRVAGYQLSFYQDVLPSIDLLEAHSVLVVINPNNPTGKLFSQSELKKYQAQLAALNGLLVVDEAFMDVLPLNYSMSSLVNNDNTLVLRSFGKFFGLAGIRIGFLITNDFWHQVFTEELGPWQVNGPAQLIAQHALLDTTWQKQQRHNLQKLRIEQETLLREVLFTKKLGKEFVTDIKGTDLFLTVSFHHQNKARELYHLLCQQGVYCRLADEQDTLRFGISQSDKLLVLSEKVITAVSKIR